MTRLAVFINPPIRAILSTFLEVDASEVARIPMEGPLIISTNHINSLDAPVGFSHLHPRPVTAFVKAETWDNWFMKFLFNAWEGIPIKRGEVDFEAFRLAEEALKQKKLVIVAPEGTRSRHGRLNQGYPGIALLALRSGAPILPVVFYGNEKIKDLRLGKRTKMVIKVGEPYKVNLNGKTLDRESRQQVTDEIMYEIARILPEENRGVYSDLTRSKREFLTPLANPTQ